MTPYQTKLKKFSGSNLKEVKKSALLFYKREVEKSSRKQPYVRSAYFKKEKVFFIYFWDHIFQKSPKERFERLKYLQAAVDLVKNSRNQPISKENPNKRGEILYRFEGFTRDKELFYIQIKEDKKSKKKYFMSCFPAKITKNSPPM